MFICGAVSDRTVKKGCILAHSHHFFTTTTSKLDTNRYLSVVVNPYEVSWREGEMFPWFV